MLQNWSMGSLMRLQRGRHEVKLMVRNITIPLAESIAAQAKELASAAEIRDLVTNASREVWSKSLGQQPK